MNPLVRLVTRNIPTLKTIFEIMSGYLSEVNIDFVQNADDENEGISTKVVRNVPPSNEISSLNQDQLLDKKQVKKHKKINETCIEPKKSGRKSKKAEQDLENGDNKTNTENNEDNALNLDKLVLEEICETTDNLGELKMHTLCTDSNIVTYIVLKANGFFKKFDVLPKKHRAGLNIDEFYKYIKNVDKDGTLTMQIDPDDTQNIRFRVRSNPGKTSRCDLKVINTDDTKKKTQIEIEFSMQIRMSSADFHKTCKDLAQFSDKVEITCEPKKLSITCKSEMSSQGRDFEARDPNNNNENDDGIVIMCFGNSKRPSIIKLQFDLKWINMMYKCQNLCKDIEIFLKPAGVMFLKYNIQSRESGSMMIVGITPSIDKEKMLHNAYDESLDKYYNNVPINII